jgi:hypothetical protein
VASDARGASDGKPNLVDAGKPKPGDSCAPSNEDTCNDPTNALVCQDGTILSVPCRGPRGCTGAGPSFACDDGVGNEGEACIMATNGGMNIACTVDKKAAVVCESGRWRLFSSCKGPNQCGVTGRAVNCDNEFADMGDRCPPQADDAWRACTTNRKSEVVCQNGTIVLWQPCKGPRGCGIDHGQVSCDTTLGSEGDICRRVDFLACSADKAQLLKCSQQLEWVKYKDCTKEGCVTSDTTIRCR